MRKERFKACPWGFLLRVSPPLGLHLGWRWADAHAPPPAATREVWGPGGKKSLEVGAVKAVELGLSRRRECSGPEPVARGPVGVGRGRAQQPWIRSPQAALCACHTSFGFIAFVQHPIVWLPLSPFQGCCLLFSSQPGCFHFFCLKFLRGRFYFQRFD